jgi:outer membrane protein OmpA-like peptidoglycan-associated protein
MNNFSFDLLNVYYEINHKNSIGYSTRIRQFGNVDGLPRQLTAAKDSNYDDSKELNTPIDFKSLNFNQFIYNEHRFHYARVIIDDKDSPHFLKAGVAYKVIMGIDATYLYADKGSFQFVDDNNSDADFTGTSFQYGRAEKANSFASRRNGFGIDLGVVYEYRPNRSEYLYEMDGEKDIERFDRKKYLYKVGASIVDIGRVRFSKDPNSYDFNNTGNPIDIDNISSLGLGVRTSFSFFKRFDKEASEGILSASNKDKFNMNLPTIFSLQGDYRFKDKIYINWTSMIPLMRRSDPNKVHLKAIQTITPRYETSDLGVMVPISFQRNAQVDLGLAARYSLRKAGVGMFLGSNNISGFFGKRASFTQNFFGGVTYSIPYKIPKDSDGDKVSDTKDECVYNFGLLKFNGCPDTDGDGVPDHLDKCMYDPGLIELNGCPDTDGDGIPDILDFCIFEPGLKEYNGCPDTDGDGIIDMNDQCPTEKGLAIHYGCPDRDGDGVIDIVDQCPDVPGIELNNGCPYNFPSLINDRDGDGVPNDIDECPDTPGSVYNKGCPIDKSNLNEINLQNKKQQKDPHHTNTKVEEIINYQDKTVGIERDSKRISKAPESESLETVNIYFNVDDATIPAKNEVILRDLTAKYGNDYVFTIIGHTDNDGSEDYNLILSRKRAQVVQRKLMTNNIKNDDIEVLYFGEWKPLRKNTSIENKQYNRRVEILISKKVKD